MEVTFTEALDVFLAELEGKTTIWCSLNLSPAQKQNKIINFLHYEGIDSSNFDFVAEV